MKLHLIGIFHTIHNLAHSHCAFTGKALRFAKMMQKQGYEVIEYANEGSESEAKDKVEILKKEELDKLLTRNKDTDFYGNDAKLGSPAWNEFHHRLMAEVRKRYNPNEDIVCHPFGHAHSELGNLGGFHVETGIGYPITVPNFFKVFESYAWMHFHLGKDNRWGKNYEWVVPNYFDLEDWRASYEPGKYILYFGRICQEKGLSVVKEIAKRTSVPVVICGQGDPAPFLDKNIEYRQPISGKDRSELLANALCSVMPTNFVEPFGGSGVEGLLCGTPLISVDYGAFTETVQHGINGFRCHVLNDWIDAIEASKNLDRKKISEDARAKYSLEACGKKYDKIFRMIDGLREAKADWYSFGGEL